MEDRYRQAAKELLAQKEETTCVVVWQDDMKKEPYISEYKGIRPLMELLEKGESLEGAYIADKVIGKAAAYLAVYGKASYVYAKVISTAAKEVLEKAGVYGEYEEEVPYIINRAGTGRCPMESAVWETEDAREAYEILKEKLQSMKKEKCLSEKVNSTRKSKFHTDD